MKTIKLIILIILINTGIVSYGQNNAMLIIVVDSIKTTQGDIFAAIFKNQDDFKADHAFQREKGVVSKDSSTINFHLPRDSAYMIAVFQDMNGNRKLDTRGAMKVPDEPIGFSNNKLARFGPPSFKETSITLHNDTTIFIHIISSRKEFFKKVE